MKLILCGGGIGKQVKSSYIKYTELLDKEKPILYIPLAWRNNDYDQCLKFLKGELTQYGVTKYEVIRDAKEFDEIDLGNYNSLYIGGGNTYKLLNYLKESRGFEVIEKYIENDGIVFGSSAGAIIFGKDIKTCNACSNDENLWLELDTSGFNSCNGKSIACHYGAKGKLAEHKEQVRTYEQKGFDIISLTEKQSIFINNDRMEII